MAEQPTDGPDAACHLAFGTDRTWRQPGNSDFAGTSSGMLRRFPISARQSHEQRRPGPTLPENRSAARIEWRQSRAPNPDSWLRLRLVTEQLNRCSAQTIRERRIREGRDRRTTVDRYSSDFTRGEHKDEGPGFVLLTAAFREDRPSRSTRTPAASGAPFSSASDAGRDAPASSDAAENRNQGHMTARRGIRRGCRMHGC